MKESGIFRKVFIYTTLFSALLVSAATIILLQQLLNYRAQLRFQSIVDAYNDSYYQLLENEDELRAFQIFDFGQSFSFYITDRSGNVVYKTRDADCSVISVEGARGGSDATIMIRLDRKYNLHALTNDVLAGNYSKWVLQAALIAVAMLAACIAGSLFFASRITKPIKALVDSTKKMANLEEVTPMPERSDELGILAYDIHSMYTKLKDEILRERELEETQRYFFSAASHELKTPVAATSVLLEGMLANVGDYKDHPKYLRECLKMIDAQSETISEILELVNLNDRKILPVPEKLDIGHVIAELLPTYQTLAEANELRIAVDIPDGQNCVADPQMLQKALSNIILNAVQNTSQGGEIRIWSESAAERYRLYVLNTGAKIDEAILPKLFDPFYRVDKARSRKDGRSGLGLAIVQKTLESMNIAFALENAPDGVLFWIDLPQA